MPKLSHPKIQIMILAAKNGQKEREVRQYDGR